MSDDITPTQAPIPVYLSRHTPNVRTRAGHGAFLGWAVGERVLVLSRHGRPPMPATITSDMRWHEEAPFIDSARGRGRWVYEVRPDGEDADCAISAAQITFAPEAP